MVCLLSSLRGHEQLCQDECLCDRQRYCTCVIDRDVLHKVNFLTKHFSQQVVTGIIGKLRSHIARWKVLCDFRDQFNQDE